jgi:hypothetical protein
VREPGPVTFALLALVAGVAIGGTLAVRARLKSSDAADAREQAVPRAD